MVAGKWMAVMAALMCAFGLMFGANEVAWAQKGGGLDPKNPDTHAQSDSLPSTEQLQQPRPPGAGWREWGTRLNKEGADEAVRYLQGLGYEACSEHWKFFDKYIVYYRKRS